MRRTFAVLLLVSSLLAFATPASAQVGAEQVEQAIERGIAYLSREQHPKGNWDERTGYEGGISCLCTLALLNAGVEPNDPRIQKSLNYLRTIDPRTTYVTSLQTMVFAAADPKVDRALLLRNVRRLEATQVRAGRGGAVGGGWSYPGGDGDGSNSQFALLALHEADLVGVPVQPQTWQLAQGYWQRGQNGDGSWGYTGGSNGSGSMTAAGISSMVIVDSKLGQPDAKVVGGRVQCCANQERNTAVEKGLEWLGRNFSVQSNPGDQGWWLYYMYGMERAGRLSAQRFFIGHRGRYDWYREGADVLVKMQDALEGHWKGVGLDEDNPLVGTSFSLLFLGKGRRPVLMSKLQHGPDQDWNNHRHDVAHLTSYVESRWKLPLSWQIIDPNGATVDDYTQSPVLFINGKERPQFTDEQVRALRAYIDRGGFLFFEACCQGDGFDGGFRELSKRLFPEPEYELHLLPPEHPIWTIEEPVDPENARPLWGIDVGCRTSVVYCPEDLSCYWELNRPGESTKLDPEVAVQVAAANSLGINVLAYATNRELKYKYEIPANLAEDRPNDPLNRARLHLAKLRHTGGWNQAPGAVVNLMKALSRETGIHVSTDRRDLAIADAKLFDYHLVLMHGRHDFRLSEPERNQLRTYIERGGMLFADSICGSEEFAAAFRREMAVIFPESSLEPIPAGHPLFSQEYGGFDLAKVSLREPIRVAADAPLKASLRQDEPELEGIKVGERYSVIFSKYDLSCALDRHASVECKGYTVEDAARIGINVVLYSLHE